MAMFLGGIPYGEFEIEATDDAFEAAERALDELGVECHLTRDAEDRDRITLTIPHPEMIVGFRQSDDSLVDERADMQAEALRFWND